MMNDAPLTFTPRSDVETLNRPSADFGSAHSFAAATSAGFESSLTGISLRAVKYKALKNDAVISVRNNTQSLQDAFITKEQWEKEYKYGNLEFEDTYQGMMSRAYAAALVRDRVRDELDAQQSMTGGRSTAALAGNLFGGLLSPIDWGLNLVVPESKAFTWGMGGTAASRASGVARIASRTANGALTGVSGALAAQPMMVAVSDYNQTKYTLDDVMTNLAVAPLIGGGAGLLHGLGERAFSRTAALEREISNYAVNVAAGRGKPEVLGKMVASSEPVKVAAATRLSLNTLAKDALAKGRSAVDAFKEWVAMAGPTVDPDHLAKANPEQLYFDPNDPRPRDTKAAITELLENPDSRYKHQIRNAASDDERWLADVWQQLFGVKLRFVDGNLADALGFSGLTRGSKPNEAFIRAGNLHEARPELLSRSMMFVAGHELGHSIRFRDPKMWSAIVGATTAAARNGTSQDLARAWKMVAEVNTETGAWAGIGSMRKMDEAYANVTGLATTSPDFWRALNQRDPVRAKRLGDAVFGLRKLLLKSGAKDSRSGSALHTYLAKVMTSIDESGTGLAAKVGADEGQAEAAVALYRQHYADFSSVAHQVNVRLSRKIDDALGRFVEYNRAMFPEVAELSDDSATPGKPGRYATVLKGRVINSNNPGLYLLSAIFSKAKPGTEEFNTYAKWMQDVFSWDEKGNLRGRKDPDSIAAALADSPVLAEFKRNVDQDGNVTWDIGVLRNQDFPRWHEILESLPDEEPDFAFSSYAREVVELFGRRAHEVWDSATFGDEFADFIRVSGPSKLEDLMQGDDHTALLRAFDDYLTSRVEPLLKPVADEFYWVPLTEREPLRGKRDQVKGLLETKEMLRKYLAEPSDDAIAENRRVITEKLNKAWNDPRNAYLKKLREFDDLRANERVNEQVKLEPGETLEQHYGRAREAEKQVILAQLREMMVMRDHLRNTYDAWRILKDYSPEQLQKYRELQALPDKATVVGPDGKEVTAANPELFKPIDPAEYDKMLKALAADKELNDLADHRLIASGQFPNYARVMKLKNHLEGDGPHSISLDGLSDQEKLDLSNDAVGEFLQEATDDFDLNQFYDDAFMATTIRDVKAGLEAERLSLAEANQLAAKRLDQEHAVHGAWAHDFETTADATISDLAKEMGVHEFSLEPKMSTVDPKAEVDGTTNKPLQFELQSIQAAFVRRTAALEHWSNTGQLDPAHPADKAVAELIAYHQRSGTDAATVIQRVYADLKREHQAKAIQLLWNEQAAKKLSTLSRQSLDHLYSYLDGSFRKGVKGAGLSVDAQMHARVTADTAPFESALLETGLMDDFRNNEEWLMRGLHDALKGREPQVAKDQVAAVQRLADTLRKIKDVQVGRLNRRGANIRLLEGHAWSQFHNTPAIAADKAGFLADLNAWLDWDEVRKSVGDNSPSGFNRTTYLEQLWHEMSQQTKEVPAGFDPATMGGNIANKVSRHRTLHFKETFSFDYDMKWGSGNTAGLITEQLMKRAEQSVIMDHFGADYKKVWGGLMQKLGRAGKWRYEKLGRIDMTFQHLVGDLNHPDDVNLAAKGRAVRNYMNSVTLWLAGISSATDLGNMTATARWMGLDANGLNSRMLAALKEQAKDPKGRQFLLAQGAGLQAILNGFSERTTMHGPMYRFASAASDFTFKWNGQEFTTRVFQSAFHDIITQHLGQMAKGELTPEFKNWLSQYQITEKDWAGLAKHAREIEGLGGVRLAPDMAPPSPAAAKLRAAILDTVNQAILQPSVSDKALLTGGFKAGTMAGEAFRTVMQYKSYPLALLRKTQRRFANAYGEQGASWTAMNRGTVDKLVWAGAMLSIAAVVLGTKDVLRGREPLNPFDSEQWNFANFSRIVMQAGVGPFSVAEQFLSARQAAGPALGSALAIGEGALSLDSYKTADAVMGSLPGASIAPVRQAARAIAGNLFTDAHGNNPFVMREAFLSSKTGQGSFFVDSPEGAN